MKRLLNIILCLFLLTAGGLLHGCSFDIGTVTPEASFDPGNPDTFTDGELPLKILFSPAPSCETMLTLVTSSETVCFSNPILIAKVPSYARSLTIHVKAPADAPEGTHLVEFELRNGEGLTLGKRTKAYARLTIEKIPESLQNH